MQINHTIMTTRTNVTMGFGGTNIRLRVARITSGRTVSEIAQEVGLDPSTVYKYENARIDFPSVNRLYSLSVALGVSYYWLLSGIGKPTMDDERNEVIQYWLESIIAETKNLKVKR